MPHESQGNSTTQNPVSHVSCEPEFRTQFRTQLPTWAVSLSSETSFPRELWAWVQNPASHMGCETELRTQLRTQLPTWTVSLSSESNSESSFPCELWTRVLNPVSHVGCEPEFRTHLPTWAVNLSSEPSFPHGLWAWVVPHGCRLSWSSWQTPIDRKQSTDSSGEPQKLRPPRVPCCWDVRDPHMLEDLGLHRREEGVASGVL